MKNIYPCLWFDGKAEEAANFYVSIFKNSKITSVSRYGDAGPLPKGTVMVVTFELDGEKFMGLNGGPQFKFSEAVSFVVRCETQQQVDHLWEKLSAGGQTQSCGWLKDKFGVSWQIVPNGLAEMLGTKDAAKAKRVLAAMMPMSKLDLAKLQKAHDGK
jgi:predicted 3-demethylubiquinone-9 3-methyltransferase (glyoxalase superfamily)